MDFSSAFATFASIVAAVPVVTEAIKKLIGVDLAPAVNQIISWVVGIAVCMLGYVFDLGCLADVTWWQALIIGFGVSLASNGVFDIEFVKWILGLIFSKIKKHE